MSVIDWLLAGDPAIRWQVRRDLLDDPEGAALDRDLVAREGWGAALLAMQREDGSWAGGAWWPAERPDPDDGQPWTGTAHVLMLLVRLGVDPGSRPVREAVRRAFDGVRWEDGDAPFLEGEDEACTLATAIAVGAYFGEDMRGPVRRLLADRRRDGGWNCDPPARSQRSSLHSTIGALEALELYRRSREPEPAVAIAMEDAHALLLERGLMYRRSTGEVIDPAFQRFSFPPYWHYDVLRALDHLRSTGSPPDPRLAEAIALVRSKQTSAGQWPLENTHRGDVPLTLEDGDGRPSRWNTLRAMRVLAWWEGA
ncbi:hypothetical protein [Demequina lignilytica]|uniref:Prenyltransferase and squalene oxidase repeat-containing protein n=1 Tax=Demequina lignilytica TaxID=3051663 RepID=A0AB35MFK6_9MICO|nr:hypothetical protein [Demequina sp. SYSU T0a273]MDN4482523.1 hypothetical protein [Demequina sp. SYSU T0a273]